MQNNVQNIISPTATPVTTVEKAAHTAIGSAVAVILLAVLSAVVGNPQLFSWKSGILVTIANTLLILIPNLLSKKTPNI